MSDFVMVRETMITLNWRGKPTPIQVRAEKSSNASTSCWVYFTPENDDTFWVLERAQFEIRPYLWSPKKPISKLEKGVKMAVEQNQFSYARRFYVPSFEKVKNGAGVCLLVKSDGQALVVSDWDNSSEIRLPVPRDEFRDWRSKRITQWLLKQWQDKESELSFVAQWEKWGQEEKINFVQEHIPGLKELLQLMTWVLQSETLLQTGYWSWYLDENNSGFHLRSNGGALDDDEVPTPFKKWREFLISRFTPLPPMNRNNLPLCIEEFEQMQRSHIVAYVDDAESLMQHERIEARLRLREWLEQNAPDRMDLLP